MTNVYDRTVKFYGIMVHTIVADPESISTELKNISAGYVSDDDLEISSHTILEDMMILYPSLRDPPEDFTLTLWQKHADGSLEFTSIDEPERTFKGSRENNRPGVILGLVLHNQNHSSCLKLDKSASISEHIKRILHLPRISIENTY
ncbi:hypothetical protein AA313_de0207370 [Arthrobotrys entomopaga]|nr:hypothetical protein AA313_de0207370 [Arthrobotrys entomopaga]